MLPRKCARYRKPRGTMPRAGSGPYREGTLSSASLQHQVCPPAPRSSPFQPRPGPRRCGHPHPHTKSSSTGVHSRTQGFVFVKIRSKESCTYPAVPRRSFGCLQFSGFIYIIHLISFLIKYNDTFQRQYRAASRRCIDTITLETFTCINIIHAYNFMFATLTGPESP